MDIMDLASKLIAGVTKRYGKKYAKTHPALVIDKAVPASLSGPGFRVGFAEREVMPDMDSGKTYWIAGHGSGHKMEGILTPVFVSAVWLDCGGDSGFVWVFADIIGLTRVETEHIRSRLSDFSARTGCKFINISCTHSHSGIDTVGYWGKANAVSIPSDGKDPEYMELLFTQICSACEQAYSERKPGKLYLGKVHAPGLQHEGRHTGNISDVLTRFRFVPDDGGREAWILNFSGHPNSLGGGNRLLSGEYPYFLREKIKADNGAFAAYGNGAIGALDMAKFSDDRVENIKLQGEKVALAAMSIGEKEETELPSEIKIINQPFLLPDSNYVLTFLAMQKTMNTDIYPDTRTDISLALKSEMTYMKIGTQQILMLPGECFPCTVFGGYCDVYSSATGRGADTVTRPLVDIAGDPDMIVFGVSNDMTGYVVPENDFVLNPTQPYLNSAVDKFGKKHYHETNSMGPGTQKAIAEVFEGIIKEL